MESGFICKISLQSLFVIILILTLSAKSHHQSNWLLHDVPDFLCTSSILDGEVEKRIHWGGINAVETRIDLPSLSDLLPGDSNEETRPTQFGDSAVSRQGLALRQVTDGKHVIQLVYDSDSELRDCEYLRDPKYVGEFFDSFSDEQECLQYLTQEIGSAAACCKAPDSPANTNFSFQILPKGEALTLDLALITDYRSLREECNALHRKVQEPIPQHGTQSNDSLGRHKRDLNNSMKWLQQNLLFFPGTRWCGFGKRPDNFEELGYNTAADRCCREQSRCKQIIEPFTFKYNYFNFRLHPISHCDCNERFKTCLKDTHTTAGDEVGSVFFNILGIDCFNLSEKNVCTETTWWGKCLKYENKLDAVSQNAQKY